MDSKTDSALTDSFPYASHINSNYIPSDDEVREIKALLSERSRRVDKIKAKLDFLQKEIAELSNMQDKLDRQVIACRSLISLPRRLPDDILREIFSQTLPTDCNALLSTKSSPILLTQICSHWRQIALSTPTIWMTIHIIPIVCNQQQLWLGSGSLSLTDDAAPGERDKQQAAAVSEWLGRSGTLPLHISLVGSRPAIRSPNIFDVYIKSIIPFVPRLKSLCLHGIYPSFTQICCLLMTELNSLESLFLDFKLHSDNVPSNDDLLSTWDKSKILRSSSLRRLSIRLESMEFTRFNINWSLLTHLALGGPLRSSSWQDSNFLSMTMTSTILKSSVSLTDCRLYFGYQGTIETEVLPMNLPLLQRLSIHTQRRITAFIDMLDVPMLEQLEFHYELDTACLASLIEKPNRIRKLILNSTQIVQVSFLDFLRKFPALVSLTVQHSPAIRSTNDYYHNYWGRRMSNIDNGPRFLESLSMNQGVGNDGICCPHLEEFICDYTMNFTWDGITEFIKRKQSGTVPGLAKLKKVALLQLPKAFIREGFEAGAVAEKLQPYISDGMEFQVEEKNDQTAFENSISTGLGNKYVGYRWD